MKKNEFIKNNPDIKLIEPVDIDGTLYVPLDESFNMYDSYYESKDGEIKQLTIVNINTCINDYVNNTKENSIIDMDYVDVDIMNDGIMSIHSDILLGIQNKLKSKGFKTVNDW